MGMPAVRHESRSASTRRPRLAVVPPASATRGAKRVAKPVRGAARRPSARARAVCGAQRVFRVFATVALVASALGLGRVWLSVQAAEASIQSTELRSHIKTERYEGDMLEVRQSALGSPSRIRAIAGHTMDMAPAQEVTYLDIAPRKGAAVAAPAEAPAQAGLGDVITKMLNLTAGEAQVLLVGDVGLASAK